MDLKKLVFVWANMFKISWDNVKFFYQSIAWGLTVEWTVGVDTGFTILTDFLYCFKIFSDFIWTNRVAKSVSIGVSFLGYLNIMILDTNQLIDSWLSTLYEANFEGRVMPRWPIVKWRFIQVG